MKIYAVIDTNVIVSALLSRHHDSATVKILDYLYDRVIVPVYNNEIIEEYVAVLKRPKFNFSEETICAVIEAIRKGGIDSERITSNEQLPDPNDIVFYEVALANEDSFLVTGNTKHFPKKPFVVTPAEMLQIIQEMKSSKHGLLSEPSARYGRNKE
ncbi:MAG: putative toxin-antitoxin system toxin component, PIN family [Bacteroidales bacterium]|nr:putative toxin-antitoxin system toxin component, PIN family [Bacteroidales bacterium]